MKVGKNLTQKILAKHLVSGTLKAGNECSFKVDQVLLQDTTGTLCCLQFEQFGAVRLRVPLGVIYVDHNLLAIDHRNPDDHIYLKDFAAKYGLWYSKPGNGICHQVHLERFAAPGVFLVGTDSHTTTAGAMGAFAVGAGGIDVAAVMAGFPFEMVVPKVLSVRLLGKLPPWVSSKDIVLSLLKRFSVKGGIGKVFEFSGPGLKTLSVTQRATIANMIAELGATTAVFPSDFEVKKFLGRQKRLSQFLRLAADENADYDEQITLDLSKIVPLVACPQSPDNVVPVTQVAGLKVSQVCLGSCVNSSFADLATVAEVFKGRKIKTDLPVTVNPGSRQVLASLSKSGLLHHLISAGARIMEPACGPCVGMGQAPATGAVSLRTFNRNFPGRSGTVGDQVYLVSPETAAASAIRGVITDPRRLGKFPKVKTYRPVIDESHFIKPLNPKKAAELKIRKGPNIKEPALLFSLPDNLEGQVAIRLGDNISTGSISPDGVLVMADRSNIPAIARHAFKKEDPQFVERAQSFGSCAVVAGENYGQGSSREHAAVSLVYLGVRVVLAKSFARIHRRNLIAQGVLPVIINHSVWEKLKVGQKLKLFNIREHLEKGNGQLTLEFESESVTVSHDLNDRERRILLCGGLLNHLRDKGAPKNRQENDC